MIKIFKFVIKKIATDFVKKSTRYIMRRMKENRPFLVNMIHQIFNLFKEKKNTLREASKCKINT